MAADNNLVTYAVIKSLHDKGVSQTDVLAPFINDVIDEEPKRARRISSLIKDKFGVHIPVSVVTDSLNRKPISTIVSKKGQKYWKVGQSSEIISLQDSLALVEGKLARLNRAADEYFKRHGWPVEAEDASQLLSYFLEKEVSILSSLLGDSQSTPAIPPGLKSKVVAVQSFVQYLEHGSQELVADLSELVAGAILSVPITLGYAEEDKEDVGFKVVLDTNILFPLLGLQSRDRIEAAEELIYILKKSGCSIYAFDFTISEATRVLTSYVRNAGSNGGDENDLSEAIKRLHWTEVEINRLVAEMDERVEGLGIGIISTKKRISEYKPSQWMADAEMNAHVHHYNDDSRRHDQLLIECIREMRSKDSRRLLDCEMIAVTGHRPLSRFAMHQLSHKSFGTIPEIINDSTVASFLWMRHPKEGIPLVAILAAASQIAKPNKMTWDSFKKALKEYHDLGEITTKDLDSLTVPGFLDDELIRHELENRKDWSLDEIEGLIKRSEREFLQKIDDEVNDRLDNLRETLRENYDRRSERMMEELRRELRSEVEAAKVQTIEKGIQNELNQLIIIEEIRARADSTALHTSNAITVSVQLFLGVSGALLLLWCLDSFGTEKTIGALNGMQLILTPIFLLGGLTSFNWSKWMRNALHKKITSKLRRRYLDGIS